MSRRTRGWPLAIALGAGSTLGVFWLLVLLLSGRLPAARTLVSISAVLGLGFAALLPLQAALARNGRRRGFGRGRVALLEVVMAPMPVILIAALFRESGDPLLWLSRIGLGEAVPWLASYALGAGVLQAMVGTSGSPRASWDRASPPPDQPRRAGVG